jgi:hypothetical protein
MHTVDVTGRTDDQMIYVITKACRTAEKWDEAKKILGFQKSISRMRSQSKLMFEKLQFKK